MNIKRIEKGIFSLVILIIASVQYSEAQINSLHLGNSLVKEYSIYTKLPCFIIPDEAIHLNDGTFTGWAKTSLGIQNNSTFRAYTAETDKLGYTHTKYKQYFNGYPVDGTMLTTHSINGQITMINGDYYQQFNNNTQASIDESTALAFALKKVNAKKYMWESPDMQKIHEQSYIPKGELVMIHKKGADYSAADVRLAYKFDIYAEEPLYRAFVYVDATNGEILEEANRICTIDVQGTANTKYSGTVNMTSDNNSGTYRLHETGRGNGIVTKNLSNGSNYSSATDFTNSSSTWNITGSNQASTDAHWGAEMTYDYYKNTFNRNSIDGNGYALNSYVHYSTNYVNAFWDGQEMTYGDGSSSQGFTIMTALDVCGHEITHGLVSNTASLGSGEAGALNEGFADIFGTTIEAYARPSQHDWLMGADIMTNHQGIRNMSNPNAIQQPDTYQGTYWDAGGEVHTNNGPCIYWYYLMCHGGSGTNDNGNSYNVSAIGMDDAAKIAFRALTVYFTSNTTYSTARTYAIQAATDLFGACSPQTIACTNAWYAVGVGSAYIAPALSSAFTANQTSTCSLPANIAFTNTTTGGSSYTWYFGDGTSSTATNPTHTYTQAGTYSVKLVAQGCTNGQDSIIKTNYIVINPPTAPTATGASRCGTGSLTLSATGSGTLNWYDAASGGNLVHTGTSYATPSLSATTTYYVSSLSQPAAVNGGPSSNTTIGAGGYLNYEHYLVFDASTDFTIQTVDIYANSTGARQIDLRDASGTTLLTYTTNITSTGLNTVPVNFHVNAGTNYRLVATGTTIDLYRNNAGASYPISVSTLASITGTDVSSTNPAYYYYFYNWKVQKDGCSSALTPVTATITQSPTIQSTSATTCSGSSTTITASGGSSYQWSNGSTGASINVSPTSTTVYTVTATVNGCPGSFTSTSTVTVNTLPNVTIAASQGAVCEGQSVTLTGSGANTYSWSTGNSSSSISVTPNTTTTYTLTGTNANNCSKTVNKTITVNPLPTVTISADHNAICAGGSVTLTASGASSYQWNNGSNGPSVSDSPNATTTYTVAGTDANNCVNTATQHITVNALPVISITANQSAICTGGSVTLTASGASSYQWNNGSNGPSVSDSPNSTTTYTVTGTDANNCINTATQQITVNALPVISIAANQSAVCAGSSVTLTASGASSYQWNNGSNGASVSDSPNATTTYTVTGTDANNCINTATQQITVNPLPAVTLNSSNDTVCSGDGPVTLSGAPAGGIYSGTAVTNNTFDPQTAGVGTFNITYDFTDGNGCSNSASVDLFVSGCTGIKEIQQVSVSVYPNPAVNTLFVKHKGNMLYSIYDMTGKLIAADELEQNTETIDITSLSSGIYFIRINADNSQGIRFIVEK